MEGSWVCYKRNNQKTRKSSSKLNVKQRSWKIKLNTSSRKTKEIDNMVEKTEKLNN